MLEGSIIYKRTHLINIKLKEYNPLEIDTELYNPETFGFEKLFLNVDKLLRKMSFTDSKCSTNTEIFLEKIERVDVSKRIKTMATIHKLYNKLKKQFIDPDEYFKSLHINQDEETSNLFNEKYRYKCLLTNQFVISLILHSGAKIELILTSYEDYKRWSSGLNSIIRDKIKLAKLKNRII